MNEHATSQQHAGGHDPHSHPVPIFIDKEKFEVADAPITGADLRNLPNPPVPADRDLWLEEPGQGDDTKVLPDTRLDPKPGMHFYTAPGSINPGGA